LNAAVYDGSTTVATATAIPGTLPAVIQFAVPNTGGTYRVRIFNGVDGCFTDATVTVAPVTCSVSCISPTASFVPVPGNCTGLTINNNGRIVLTASANADKYGVNPGANYTGGPSYSGATTIGALPVDVQGGILNTGGTYTIRMFNGSNSCFRDYTIVVPATNCPVDPMGFIYCEETGMIIAAGTITVTPPAGATYVITQNGSTGAYQFFTDGTPGVYTMIYTPPAGYMASTIHISLGTLDPTGQPNPYTLGSGSANGITLNNFTAGANPFYMAFDFQSGDPEILDNNIPLKGCCVSPTLTADNGQVCQGGSIDLASLVTNAGGGSLTYHTTLDDAQNDANALPSSIVTPASATNYYVRSEINTVGGQTCYSVKEVTVTMKPTNCGAILSTQN